MLPDATGMPALPGIIAKVLVLVERVMDCFVQVTYTASNATCCSYGAFDGALTTGCGDDLAVQLSSMLMQGMTLLNNIIGALTVTVN